MTCQYRLMKYTTVTGDVDRGGDCVCVGAEGTCIFFFLFFFFFFFFRATLTACGGSKARGQIRATAAGLNHSHSNLESEPQL